MTKEDRVSLTGHDWPGNTRQRIKVVKRAVYLEMPIAEVIDEERRLGLLDVATEAADPMTFLPKTAEEIRPLEESRSAYARCALALHRGNVHATARAPQITDRTLLARLGERPAETATRIGKARQLSPNRTAIESLESTRFGRLLYDSGAADAARFAGSRFREAHNR